MTLIGSIAQVRRYPVKSMLGDIVPSGAVTERGLSGDRGWALIHRETGKVASAKQPRLWRDLLTMRAEHVDGGVVITLPEGGTVHSGAPDADEVLSKWIGQPVRLTDTPPAGATFDRADPDQVLRDGITAEVDATVGTIGAATPGGTFVDFAPLHLVATSTLDHITERSATGPVDAVRYRPNIVLATDAPAFCENEWLGRQMRIGESVVLLIAARTPRCAIPTLAHGDRPRNVSALRVPAAENRVRPFDDLPAEPCVGCYATVQQGGTIREGDQVRLM